MRLAPPLLIAALTCFTAAAGFQTSFWHGTTIHRFMQRQCSVWTIATINCHYILLSFLFLNSTIAADLTSSTTSGNVDKMLALSLLMRTQEWITIFCDLCCLIINPYLINRASKLPCSNIQGSEYRFHTSLSLQ